MRTRSVPFGRQRGMALIVAMLLTTLAITIVASLFWQQQVQVRSIENLRLQLQKQWILRGALDWAGLILREDARYSSVDNLDEPWAVALAETRLDQYIEGGSADADIAGVTLSGGISDAKARYNLTNLCPNGIIDPAEVAVFARLLEHEKLDPALAQATAAMMEATQGKPESIATDNRSLPASQPTRFVQTEDLLAVPGFLPEMVERLKDFVIFLPRATSVNVNTAPAEVLAAIIDRLSPADATALVNSRKSASFRDLADFASRLPNKSFNASSGRTSVTTDYFLVNGKVSMSRAGLEMQALVERNGANTRTLWIREH